MTDDVYRERIKSQTHRVESLELAANEHVIGVDVHHGKTFVMGLQWHTVKIF